MRYDEIKAMLAQEGSKTRKSPSHVEHDLQCAEVRYIRGAHPDLSGVFFSVPNGTNRTGKQTNWLKEEGLLPGVSDMLLLHRTSQYAFLCIENKTKTGRQSPEQKVFQFEVERHGGKYIIIRSIDEFMTAIENYLNGEL